MSEIENKVKETNKQIIKSEKEENKAKRKAEIEAKIQKVASKIKELKDNASEKVEDVKNSVEELINEAKTAREEQAKIESIYKQYIEFATANKNKVGTFERATEENGATKEIVYTEHGPIINGKDEKGEYYEGFAPRETGAKKSPIEYTRVYFKHIPGGDYGQGGMEHRCGEKKVEGFMKNPLVGKITTFKDSITEERDFRTYDYYFPKAESREFDRYFAIKKTFENEKTKALSAQQEAESEGISLQ